MERLGRTGNGLYTPPTMAVGVRARQRVRLVSQLPPPYLYRGEGGP
jgi:hypothetical protein